MLAYSLSEFVLCPVLTGARFVLDILAWLLPPAAARRGQHMASEASRQSRPKDPPFSSIYSTLWRDVVLLILLTQHRMTKKMWRSADVADCTGYPPTPWLSRAAGGISCPASPSLASPLASLSRSVAQ